MGPPQPRLSSRGSDGDHLDGGSDGHPDEAE
jgi:hypothetical protein